MVSVVFPPQRHEWGVEKGDREEGRQSGHVIQQVRAVGSWAGLGLARELWEAALSTNPSLPN